MLLINCPHCGERAQTEFTYVRTIDSIVPLDAASDAAMHKLYERANPRGVDDELWRHTYGCRQFITMRRHRVTHVIEHIVPYGEALP